MSVLMFPLNQTQYIYQSIIMSINIGSDFRINLFKITSLSVQNLTLFTNPQYYLALSPNDKASTNSSFTSSIYIIIIIYNTHIHVLYYRTTIATSSAHFTRPLGTARYGTPYNVSNTQLLL